MTSSGYSISQNECPKTECPNVLMQCKQTLLDDPIKLITLVVCSLSAVYIVDMGITWSVQEHHYKSRAKRRALIQCVISNLLLLTVYFIGIDPMMNMNVVSILLLTAVILGLFSVVNGTKHMEPAEGGVFVTVEALFFFLFYKMSSK